MSTFTRRSFMQSTFLAAPFFIGGVQSLLADSTLPTGRRPAASDKLTLALIGCGIMGQGNLRVFLSNPRVRVVAACDPVADAPGYDYNAKGRGGRDVAKRIIDEHYKNKDCRSVADWRAIIADPTIDAVCIATPDHWHALIAIAAMKAGKHVYCQKPMTLGVSEGLEMVRVAKQSRVKFQVGSQQRSAPEFRVAAELVRNGYLGECMRCDIGLPGNNKGMFGHGTDTVPRQAPGYFAAGMWDLWQGPAAHWPDDAFIPGIHEPMCWRYNSRTGGGHITDWGAHHVDILQWALGVDRSGPVAIENMKTDLGDDKYFDWAANYSFDLVYANGFRATVSNKFPNGLCFHGKVGDLFVKRGAIDCPQPLKKWNEKKDLKDSDVHLHHSRNHEYDFVEAIFNNSETACDCEIGHRSITPCHLANICERLRISGLKWDPAKERIINNPEASKLLEVPHANGWKLV